MKMYDILCIISDLLESKDMLNFREVSSIQYP